MKIVNIGKWQLQVCRTVEQSRKSRFDHIVVRLKEDLEIKVSIKEYFLNQRLIKKNGIQIIEE